MYLLIYFHCKLFSSVFEFSKKKALKICIIIIIIIIIINCPQASSPAMYGQDPTLRDEEGRVVWVDTLWQVPKVLYVGLG